MDDLAIQMFGDTLTSAPNRRDISRLHRADRQRRRRFIKSGSVVAAALLAGGTTAVVTGVATAGETRGAAIAHHITTVSVDLLDGRTVQCAATITGTPALDCNWERVPSAPAGTHKTPSPFGIVETNITDDEGDDVVCLSIVNKDGSALSCEWQHQN